METIKQWWSNDLSRGVKLVFLVLLANGLPAFIILMSIPGKTESFFVWTVRPEINARLLGVMYSNALMLVLFGALQRSWARVRITMVVITLFSVLATVLTFFYLKPFLAHPWYHLTYWLTMYLVLFVAAPFVFVTHERKGGGRLPVSILLTSAARAVAGSSLAVSLFSAGLLLFRIDVVNQVWLWKLPPLVGGLIGVLFLTHAAAYAWALWDGDWLRVRPMFWQAPLTGLLFLLLPLIHRADLHPDMQTAVTAYTLLAGLFVLAYIGVILGQRAVEQRLASHAS